MPETIYKYRIELEDITDVELPEDAVVLHFDAQGEALAIWVLLNPDDPKVVWRFRLRGTGHPMPEGRILDHIGTCQHRGQFVWHLFRDQGDVNEVRFYPPGHHERN